MYQSRDFENVFKRRKLFYIWFHQKVQATSFNPEVVLTRSEITIVGTNLNVGNEPTIYLGTEEDNLAVCTNR